MLLVNGPAKRNKGDETTGRVSTTLSKPTESGALLDFLILVPDLNSGAQCVRS